MEFLLLCLTIGSELLLARPHWSVVSFISEILLQTISRECADNFEFLLEDHWRKLFVQI